MKNLYWELKIEHHFSTLAYPQGNGQAKASNKALISMFKKRLEMPKTKWVDEFPAVLCAYRTTPHLATKETSFSLAYEAEAVVLGEVGEPSLRV